jgi:OMF family outer membrane factor
MKLVSIHKLIVVLMMVLFFTPVGITQKAWSLKQCIDTAKVNNKQMTMSARNIDAASENQAESRAQLIPKLMVNADYKYFTNLPYQLMPLSVFGGPEGQFKETQFGVPHNISANLQLSIPLYNPQIYGGIEAAEKGVKLQELVHQKTTEEVFFEVSNLYYNAQIIKSNLAFLDSNIINTERVLKNTKALANQLLAKKSDVSKIQLKMDQLNNQRAQTESQYEQVMNALKFLIGIDFDRDIQIEQAFQFESPQEYEEKITLDMQIAQTKLSLASTELKIAKRSRLPSLSLIGSYGTTGFGYDKEPNRFLNFYPIGFGGVRLTYPLFNGTVTQRKINQKNIAQKNAQTSAELTDDESRLSFINARLKLNTAYSNILQTGKQVGFAKEIFQQTLNEYKQELASLTELLMSDSELQKAQIEYLNAVISYLKADLVLKKQSGNFNLN